MTAPVNVTGRERRRYVDVARTAWGDDLPDWALVLAEEIDRTTQIAAGRRVGYSPSVIVQAVSRSYSGDLASVANAVRGALMGETVICPALGEIGRDLCLDEQRMPGVPTSGARMQVWRACRAGCPNWKHRSDQ